MTNKKENKEQNEIELIIENRNSSKINKSIIFDGFDDGIAVRNQPFICENILTDELIIKILTHSSDLHNLNQFFKDCKDQKEIHDLSSLINEYENLDLVLKYKKFKFYASQDSLIK